MAYTRVSPGVWKDSKTGKTIRSTTDPNKKAGNTAATGGNQKAKRAKTALSRLDKGTQKDIAAQKEIANEQAQANLRYGNVQYKGPTGATSNVTYDENGNPIMEQSLGGTQQGIYDLSQELASKGLGGYSVWSGGQDPTAERARIEQDVYGRLTKNVDRDFNQERDEMERRMYNRGIPLDPTNPAYKRELDALNEKYSAIKSNAAQQATEIGGNEYQRNVNIGLAGQQQKGADIGFLTGGAGIEMPNLPGFQGTSVDYGSPIQGSQFQKTLAENRRQANQDANLKVRALNKARSGGSSTEDTGFETSAGPFA